MLGVFYTDSVWKSCHCCFLITVVTTCFLPEYPLELSHIAAVFRLGKAVATGTCFGESEILSLITQIMTKTMFVTVFDSVKEDVFWRNYFYRVSLIKQSAQLTALAAQQQQQQQDGEDQGASVSPEDMVLKGDDTPHSLTHSLGQAGVHWERTGHSGKTRNMTFANAGKQVSVAFHSPVGTNAPGP